MGLSIISSYTLTTGACRAYLFRSQVQSDDLYKSAVCTNDRNKSVDCTCGRNKSAVSTALDAPTIVAIPILPFLDFRRKMNFCAPRRQ